MHKNFTLFFHSAFGSEGGNTIIQIYKIYPFKYFTYHIIMYIDGIFAKGYSLYNLSDCICVAVLCGCKAVSCMNDY